MEMQIFDPETFRRLAQQIDGPDATDDDVFVLANRTDDVRAKYLRSLAADPRRGMRDLLMPDPAMVTRLLGVEADHPNFAAASGVFIRAARLCALTGASLSVPPLLLVGPPGIGKSTFARALCEALRTDVHEIAGPGCDDSSVLVGTSPVWRNARPGAIVRALVTGDTAQPIVLIDEIDKVPRWRESGDPLDTLHAALEPANAQSFTDSYLESPVAAHRVIWLATANDVSALKPTILDRFLVLPVTAPGTDATLAIMRNIYRNAVEPYCTLLSEDLDSDLARALVDATPRRLRLIFQLAAGFAAAEKRRGLWPSDIENAQRLLTPEQRTSFGFVAL
jgi:Cdc6-like AAA superfamily ATPase